MKTASDYLNEIERLLAEKQPDRALSLAKLGHQDKGGAVLGRRYAELAADAGQINEAELALRQVMEREPDLAALRDLVILQRDWLGDMGGARQNCLRGLTEELPVAQASTLVDATEKSEERQLIRLELATLYLRLHQARHMDEALQAIGVEQFPFVERLSTQAFALGREGEDEWAIRLFREALARDPYHPVVLYDLACTWHALGYRRGAESTLLEAVRNGDARMAKRFAHDPDLVGLELNADRRPSHSLEALQVRPATTQGGIRFQIRADKKQRAYDLGIALDLSDVHAVLKMHPHFMRCSPDTAEAFDLWMEVDRSSFRGYELHRQLRCVAPLVEDTHGFVYDWNVGGYLDEIIIANQKLTLIRRYCNDHLSHIELLEERLRLSPDDRLLAAVVESARSA